MASTPEPPPFTEAASPGRLAGDYDVGARLRAGWAGPIMDGRYRRTGRRVTVQVVRDELAGRAGFTERLATVGRRTATLRDPHLVALYDLVDTDHGLHLIAEWCDVQPLAGRRPDARGAAVVIDGVLGGLAVLHGAGLVHGHLDPQTVVVEPDGRARLAELAVSAAASPSTQPLDDVGAAARLGLALLPRGRRLDGLRRVLGLALQEGATTDAGALRTAFAEAATAALGDAWRSTPAVRRTPVARRRLAAALVAAAVVAAGLLGVLLLRGPGGGGSGAGGPLTLGTDTSLSVSPPSGGCNTTFVFVGRGSVRGAGMLIYRWEQSDGAASADTPLAVTADDGSFQLTQAWRLQGAQTVDGAMTLHILKPVDRVLRRTFRYACA